MHINLADLWYWLVYIFAFVSPVLQHVCVKTWPACKLITLSGDVQKYFGPSYSHLFLYEPIHRHFTVVAEQALAKSCQLFTLGLEDDGKEIRSVKCFSDFSTSCTDNAGNSSTMRCSLCFLGKVEWTDLYIWSKWLPCIWDLNSPQVVWYRRMYSATGIHHIQEDGACTLLKRKYVSKEIVELYVEQHMLNEQVN